MTRFVENPEWRAGITEYNREMLSDVVSEVHEIADRIVPRDTGRLESRLYSYVDIDGKSGVVGDDADYARWVEEGHRVAYRDSNDVTQYTGDVVPAQPYLRVGLNSAKPK